MQPHDPPPVRVITIARTHPRGRRRKRNERRELSPRNELFINHWYAQQGNATKTGEAMGFNRARAQKLLDRPSVRAEIERRNRLLTKNAIASTREVFEILTAIARGKPGRGQASANASDRISACRVLNRMRGLDTRRVALSIDLSGVEERELAEAYETATKLGELPEDFIEGALVEDDADADDTDGEDEDWRDD